MIDFFSIKKPEEVFTPRASHVNKEMYVERGEHQRHLDDALRSGYHLIIYGDSGCGKSWLYKHVFETRNIFHVMVDFSSAYTADDVDLLILDALPDKYKWSETRKVETNEEEVKYIAGVKSARTTELNKNESSAFGKLVRYAQQMGHRKKSCIVFENLEYVISREEVMECIRHMLLSLDDRNFGKKNIQICLIGVPDDIKNIITDGNKYQTLSNRVTEIPEVGRMSKDQAEYLIVHGLESELDFSIRSKVYCVSQIIYLTDRIPQYIQDLCLRVAFLAESNNHIVEPNIIELAAENWIDASGRQSKEFIKKNLGRGRQKSDQKSRVIYAISKCEKIKFYPEDIEIIMKNEFPISCGSRRLQVLRTLNSLSDGEDRLLKKEESDIEFRIINPKVRSVLRHCLSKDEKTESIRLK